MEEMKKILCAEESRLKKIIQEAERRLKDAPKGTLHLSSNKSGRMYYQYDEKETYLSLEKIDLIKALAQKSYDEKVLKKGERILAKIKSLLKELEKNDVDNIYSDEHVARQKLVTPIEPTWEQRVEEFRNRSYEGLGFKEDIPVILTEKGERVRSKSEKIIADYFYKKGIEYKYECPVYLKGVGWVYPDFTILSKKLKKIIFYEHFGMMDDPNYARKAINKIVSYEENGIYIGDSLIVTYETEKMILSTQHLELLIEKYIL